MIEPIMLLLIDIQSVPEYRKLSKVYYRSG